MVRPWHLTALALLGLGAWVVPAQPVVASLTSLVFGQFPGPEGPITTEWQLPDGEPRGWVLLQHGFARQCANLRSTARRLAQSGMATLCLQADMAEGAPALAKAVAHALQVGGDRAPLRPPGSTGAGQPWVLAGHSAGALFAARVAQALALSAPERVAGLIMLDPVGGSSLSDALAAVVTQGRLPVRALLAPPSRCNGQQMALPALLRAQAVSPPGRVSLQFPAEASHLDAEGEDTERLAVWMCGEGWPDATRTEDLRTSLLTWVGEVTSSPPAGLSRPAPRP